MRLNVVSQAVVVVVVAFMEPMRFHRPMNVAYISDQIESSMYQAQAWIRRSDVTRDGTIPCRWDRYCQVGDGSVSILD